MVQPPPGRIFLDTCVINFILDYGDQIHQGEEIPAELPARARADIQALHELWDVGQRAFWQLAISPLSYREVTATPEPSRADWLGCWFAELWNYWRELMDSEDNDLPTLIEAEEARIGLLASGDLEVLPHLADRLLLCDAIVYRCDLFCTRDWRTILKHRDALSHLPIKIVTPTEWWREVAPFAGLWH